MKYHYDLEQWWGICQLKKSNNKKCFQYAATVALYREEIKRDSQRISKIKPFVNKYNWNGIKYLPERDVLYIKEKEIFLAYISKHGSTHEKNNFLKDPKQKKKADIILQ